MTDLPMGKWSPMSRVLPAIKERLSVHDGGKFILSDWTCKYIDARIDMRTGSMYLTPGNTPNPETKP